MPCYRGCVMANRTSGHLADCECKWCYKLQLEKITAENAMLREAITECIGILALQHYDKYIAEARILHATNDCKCKIAATLRIARAALAKGGA